MLEFSSNSAFTPKQCKHDCCYCAYISCKISYKSKALIKNKLFNLNTLTPKPAVFKGDLKQTHLFNYYTDVNHILKDFTNKIYTFSLIFYCFFFN